MIIKSVFRERHYWFHGDRIWFEECPVIAETALYITVRSQTFDTIQYPGGDFRLDKENLLRSGKKYHSRHGEWFHLEKPRLGDLFPSKELLQTPDFLMQEAAALGWDVSVPLHQWNEEDKACWMYCFTTKKPLTEAVSILAKHGLRGLAEATAIAVQEQRARDMLLIFAG